MTKRLHLVVMTLLLVFVGEIDVFSQNSAIEQLKKRVDQLEKNVKEEKYFRVSGYLQTDLNLIEKDGEATVGTTVAGRKLKGSWDADNYFMRAGIRRGRLKFSYSKSIYKSVFELDMNEGGVGIKQIYMQILPKNSWFSGSVGLQGRPFGYEANQSSSTLEAMERSMITRGLFNGEKDLGVLLRITPPKESSFYGFQLNAGVYNGCGIKKADDGYYDFIGRLNYHKTVATTYFNIGASLYYGGAYNSTYDPVKKEATVYKVKNGAWTEIDDDNLKYNKRLYYGFDGQVRVKTKKMGTSLLKGEYLFGEQPSTSSLFSFLTKGSATTLNTNYIRKFRGAYLSYIQDFFNLPLASVVRYSYFDPNIKLKGEEVERYADVQFNAIGFGAIWQINNAFRLQAYYEFLMNEACDKKSIYADDINDDMLTLRLQYKF